MSDTLKLWRVLYTALPAGARIKSHGEFKIAAKSREDVMEVCRRIWPEMDIDSCEVES